MTHMKSQIRMRNLMRIPTHLKHRNLHRLRTTLKKKKSVTIVIVKPPRTVTAEMRQHVLSRIHLVLPKMVRRIATPKTVKTLERMVPALEKVVKKELIPVQEITKAPLMNL